MTDSEALNYMLEKKGTHPSRYATEKYIKTII